MSVAIRELGLSDRLMVGELLDALVPGWIDALAPGASGPTAFIADPASFMIGAYLNNEPAGMAWGSHMRCPDGAKLTHLHRLEVAERFRRRGLGLTLFEAAVALARRTGSCQVQLPVGTQGEASRALYSAATELDLTESNSHFWLDLI